MVGVPPRAALAMLGCPGLLSVALIRARNQQPSAARRLYVNFVNQPDRHGLKFEISLKFDDWILKFLPSLLASVKSGFGGAVSRVLSARNCSRGENHLS